MMWKVKNISVVLSSTVILLLSVTLLPTPPPPGIPFSSAVHVQPPERTLWASRPVFQYEHDIRANEHGIVEYPMGYHMTEYRKAVATASVPNEAGIKVTVFDVIGRRVPCLPTSSIPQAHTN